MATNQRILICEPFCRGYEHRQFNAPFLATVRLAYPDSAITFMAEAEHLACVRNILRRSASASSAAIQWRKWRKPFGSRRGLNRLCEEFRIFRELLRRAKVLKADRILITCITDTGLLALRMLLGISRLPVQVVLHGNFGSVLQKCSSSPWAWLKGFRQVLRLPHPPGLGYIVLGPSILREVERCLPRWADRFRSLEHPFLWEKDALSGEFSSPDVLRFGFVGVGALKAFSRLEKVMTEANGNRIKFSHAGFVSDPAVARRFSANIPDITTVPLTDEEYAKRFSNFTYALLAGDAQHYRMSASASFLDALSYLKPAICLRSAYVEHYFERMGDIGYLCNSYEEMAGAIRSIISHFPAERYRRQVENIVKQRVIFEPARLAPRLQAIVEGWPHFQSAGGRLCIPAVRAC